MRVKFPTKKKNLYAYQARLRKRRVGGLSQLLFPVGSLKLQAGGHPVPSGGALGRGPFFLLLPSTQAWEDVDREWTCGVFTGALPAGAGGFQKLTTARLSSFGVLANMQCFSLCHVPSSGLGGPCWLLTPLGCGSLRSPRPALALLFVIVPASRFDCT